jgi:plasmid stabilization system protein ParE
VSRRRFVLTPEARADLIEIRNYIAQDSIDGADQVLARLYDAFTRLGQTPAMGHHREDLADSRAPLLDGILLRRRLSLGDCTRTDHRRRTRCAAIGSILSAADSLEFGALGVPLSFARRDCNCLFDPCGCNDSTFWHRQPVDRDLAARAESAHPAGLRRRCSAAVLADGKAPGRRHLAGSSGLCGFCGGAVAGQPIPGPVGGEVAAGVRASGGKSSPAACTSARSLSMVSSVHFGVQLSCARP